jgi:hypothetical protein
MTKHAKLVMVVISRRLPRAPLDMWAHSGAFLASRRKSGQIPEIRNNGKTIHCFAAEFMDKTRKNAI